MCRLATAQFEARISAPFEARRWVADRLRSWGLESFVDACRLLTSELVANAVVHASGSPVVAVSVADGLLEVGVTDGERFSRRPGTGVGASWPGGEGLVLAEGGRGLLLVEAMTDAWGATSLPTGKHVWFRLDVGEWRDRAACRCHEEGPDRDRLHSGRHVLDMLAGRA